MNNEIMRREMKEALDAGERALRSLRSAQEKLNSVVIGEYLICLVVVYFLLS